jgi:hypothetical protein
MRSISEEVNRDVLAILPEVLLSYSSTLHQHLGAAMSKLLHSRGNKEKTYS